MGDIGAILNSLFFLGNMMMTTPHLKGDVNKEWGNTPQVVTMVQLIHSQ